MSKKFQPARYGVESGLELFMCLHIRYSRSHTASQAGFASSHTCLSCLQFAAGKEE